MSVEKKKGEFSKRIFVGVTVGVVLIVIFSCLMIWRTGDTSPLTYIIGGAFAELATATGFYYNKAREENKLKLMQQHNVQPKDQHFQ